MSFCERKGVDCEYKILCNIHPDSITADSCQKNLPDINIPKFEPKNIEFGVLNLKPNLNEITGIVDTETDGKKFAIGTKNQATGFVLNFGNRSCLLFMGDIQPIDLRNFNFDEFTSIEINGNRFIREDRD